MFRNLSYMSIAISMLVFGLGVYLFYPVIGEVTASAYFEWARRCNEAAEQQYKEELRQQQGER